MITWLSRHVFYPLWDLREGNLRLKTMRRLEASQWKTSHEILSDQWRTFTDILYYAYSNCPHYRRSFEDAAVTPGDIRTRNDLVRLPLLTKNDIRVYLAELISREFRMEDLVQSRTGGSTGTSLTIYCDPRCREARNGAALHADRWAGWQPGEKIAAIWGNPPIADTLKKKIRNLLHDRTMYLDTMNLNEEALRRFAEQCVRHKPSAFFGHSHSIFIFAQFLERAREYTIRPRAIISTSMMLLDSERSVIERALGCPVTNRYGCEEVGLVACECEKHSGLHMNAEHVLVEIIGPDGAPVGPGQEGEIVVTDLLNRGMPLIRYRVGDMGIQATRQCACGRGLPLLERVTGRVADFLIRRDGSLVAGVSLVERTLTAIPGIEQMQIVQEAIDRFTINVVPGSKYTPASHAALRAEFSVVFGHDAYFDITLVSSLDQTASGKFRFAICKLRDRHPAYAG